MPQDTVFGAGLLGVIKTVMQQRAASPEDLLSNPQFQARWGEVCKVRSEEVVAEKLEAQRRSAAASGNDNEGVVEVADPQGTPGEAIDHRLRGGKSIDRCEHNTKQYWDAYAAQQVRQFVKLAVEPGSSAGVAAVVKESVLAGSYLGEPGKSSILIVLEVDSLCENAARPVDRKPAPNQGVISKLLQGTLLARNGTRNEDGMCNAPCEQDVLFLVDGGRDTCKAAMSTPTKSVYMVTCNNNNNV
jgi:hypothetical protein